MGRQIVQNDDVARLESRSQLSLDVSFKNAPVHRRVNDEGGGQGVEAQAGDEGLRLPVSERDFRKPAFAPSGCGLAGAPSWWSFRGGIGLLAGGGGQFGRQLRHG